jgi:hypothetical protein
MWGAILMTNGDPLRTQYFTPPNAISAHWLRVRSPLFQSIREGAAIRSRDLRSALNPDVIIKSPEYIAALPRAWPCTVLG